MSLALIQESAREVRRLAIAGSTLAIGDFRLKKLIPPLEQAGAKVPVFAQVAKAIQDLVQGPEADSAARLLALSTLLNAILYTQGQTGHAAKLEEIPNFTTHRDDGPVTTRTPARLLRPIIEALSTTGSGRFETVRTAVENGTFQDIRLMEPALRALDDVYPELADLVAEKILPGYGRGIAPLLKKNLSLKGKSGDARRLRVLHGLDPETSRELCKTALEEGSAEVKEAAILCLGGFEDCIPLLLEQAKAKNKTLRAAALRALAGHDRPDTTRLFSELIEGKSLEPLVESFGAIRSGAVVDALLEESRRVFAGLVKGDETLLERYVHILNCLRQRKEPAVQEMVFAHFGQSDGLTKLKAAKNSHIAGADVASQLTATLYAMGTPAAHQAILARRAALPATDFPYVLRSALLSWKPAQIYDEFHPLLENKKGAGREKRDQLVRTIWATSHPHATGYFYSIDVDPDSDEAGSLTKIQWDPRWLDALIPINDLDAVCSLARPGHAGVVKYLLKLTEAKNAVELGQIIEALVRCQYPKVTETFIQLVKKHARGKATEYQVHVLFASARYLPPADLPALDALATTLDEKFVDHFLEALAPLRTSPAAATATASS
jgi:hypothetical protein